MLSHQNDTGTTTRVEYRDDAAGLGPQHRRAAHTIVDPEGLHLVTSVGFEPPGSGRLRPVSRTRPAGPETTATTAYYGDAELRDNPCTRAGDRANQAGLVQFETSADPDGAGPSAASPLVTVVSDPAGMLVTQTNACSGTK